MADIARMESALRNAHAAGDAVAAKAIANALKQARLGAQGEPDQGTMAMVGQAGTDSGNIAAALSEFTGGKPTDKYAQDTGIRANMEARLLMDKLPSMKGGLAASSAGVRSGSMLGFDDEIAAAMMAPVRMIRDRVGPSEAYNRQVALERAIKERQKEGSPILSTVGEIAGGLGTGGALAKGGVTLAGRNLPMIGRTGAAAIEGAAYGGIYGAGNADGRDMASEAAKGALIGAGTGAATQAIGGAIGNALTRRAAAKATPAADELANAANALYQQADSAGIVMKPQALNRLGRNIKMVAGGRNDVLRRNTAGILDDIDTRLSQPMTLREFDEFRQEIGLAMKRAEPQDARSLARIKEMVDNFADNVKAGDFTGDVRGFQYVKDARALWQRKAKTEKIDALLDMADVDTGQYTQSGAANTIRRRFKSLYADIMKGREKGWTKEEVDLIRQIAKGGSNSQMVNLLAKLAPRGVVSAGVGGIAGTSLGGPIGGAAVLAAGDIAARVADRGAINAAQSVRNAAASGMAPVTPNGQNNLIRFIPGAVIGVQEGSRGLLQPSR